ncbi:MAG: AzlC family ABC transporter permease [Ruminococcus sp.]|nr:AzlC family ABC transporter permease [Ruminococcus sp.]
MKETKSTGSDRRTAKRPFLRGLVHGIPIGLGYLSVSFGFGIAAVRSGLSVTDASVISLTNLTSAGQAAGINIIAAGGTLAEMALVQFVINLRYALMALSLSQKLDKSFTLPHRLLAAYGITDEIFAVCSCQPGNIVPAYMYGVIAISTLGWVLGTFLGALMGEILPRSVTAALGLMLYGMFIAIIVPPSKKHKSVLAVVCTAAALSVACRYLLPNLSGGFSVIICAAAASVLGALIFPKDDDDTAENEEAAE